MPRKPLCNNHPRAAKAVRIGLRAIPKQEALIRRAAARIRKSVTEFVLDSTCAMAEGVEVLNNGCAAMRYTTARQAKQGILVLLGSIKGHLPPRYPALSCEAVPPAPDCEP